MKILITHNYKLGIEQYNAYLVVNGDLYHTTHISEQGARTWLKAKLAKLGLKEVL
jgi:hypothetical protein